MKKNQTRGDIKQKNNVLKNYLSLSRVSAMFPNAQLAFSATGRLSSLRSRRMCSEQSSKNEASYQMQN